MRGWIEAHRVTLAVSVAAMALVPLSQARALTIDATYNANLSASATSVIHDAIQFYQTTFSDPITVYLNFYNMGTGLGSNLSYLTTVDYPTYRAALNADATSADDAIALANTPSGPTNPVTSSSGVNVKTANARAIGLNAFGGSFSFAGSPCMSFTGDSCIGLNLAITDDADSGVLHGYSLISVIEHEVNEALGLGSELNSPAFLGGHPQAEDLFRWANPGVRSFSTQSCASPPAAFFSIDGGVTSLNQFHNCGDGADYGDWITHTPTQVQDAITNNTATPFMTATSSETRALDVLGYTFATKVAEPASLGFLSLGLFGIAAFRRRSTPRFTTKATIDCSMGRSFLKK